jgi:hypothetical protein
MSLPLIYADFNGIGPSQRNPAVLAVPLDTLGSLQALSNAGIRLEEGARISIYDWSDEEEDLLAAAVAYFDAVHKVWVAELGPEGYSYVPKGARDLDNRFLCLGCRHDLGAAPSPAAAIASPQPTCPTCGVPRDAAVAPPAA